MLWNRISLGLLLASIGLADCTCDDSLAIDVGELEPVLCDREPACECVTVVSGETIIDFSSPAYDPVAQSGAIARRSLLLTNINQPRKLTVSRIEIEGEANGFAVTGVQARASDAADAEVENHDMAEGPLVLDDAELGEVFLAFQPGSELEHTATLVIISDSAGRRRWEIDLRGGGGDASACVPDGSCGEGSEIDFGTHQDEDIAYDSAAGLPLALGAEEILVTNASANELFFTAILTNDGIAEGPGEAPGDRGVFFLGELGCTIVGPGEVARIPVEYRPSTAGEHLGEILIKGVGAPIRVALHGRVIGAHICFRTEDEMPSDSTLQFGDPPDYQTAVNAVPPELRRIWVQNCGFQENLEVTDLSFVEEMSPDFGSPALPWTSPGPVAPGAEIEVPVTLTPSSPQLSGVNGRAIFSSNDTRMPTAFINLTGFIGPPKICLLAASPEPVDFGWVATDDANQSNCTAPNFPPGCQVLLSRAKLVRLVNVGQQSCSEVTIGPVLPGTSASRFTMVEAGFDATLANDLVAALGPGETSDPITLLFKEPPREVPVDLDAALQFSAVNNFAGNDSVLLKVKSGGSPACELGFQPVSPPTVFCNQDSVAFGNVNYGAEKTIQLQVKNIGSEACAVGNVRRRSGTSTNFTFPLTSFPIPVGQSHILPITFTAPLPTGDPMEEFPFACGGNGMLMDYSSTSMVQKTAELAFSGMGKPPAIDVIPGEIDFGEVTVGCCSARERIAIYNTGDATLTIDGVSMAGNPSDFANTQPADRSLSSGESTVFYAQYCASAEGVAADQVQVAGQDSNGNDELFSVSLSGTGVLDSAGTDDFQQPGRPMVDVLFVVDDSGSMDEEQDELAANFTAFIGRALTLNTDYHLGVTNTDGETEWSGRLHACSPGPEGRFIVDYQPDAQQESQFRCNVKTAQPADGRPSTDSKEAALQAARACFEYPTAEWNVGFYREEAKLYIILITDEADQSDGTADLYVDYFRNLKGIGNPDLLNISAITGPPPEGCEVSGNSAAANQLDFDAVQAAGGQFRSICAADWTDLLDSLGLDVFNSRRQFALSRAATAATIEVRKCSGACPADPYTCPIVPRDASNGWTFDAGVNAVSFNGSAIPGAGECIWITYTAVCFQAGEG